MSSDENWNIKQINKSNKLFVDVWFEVGNKTFDLYGGNYDTNFDGKPEIKEINYDNETKTLTVTMEPRYDAGEIVEKTAAGTILTHLGSWDYGITNFGKILYGFAVSPAWYNGVAKIKVNNELIDEYEKVIIPVKYKEEPTQTTIALKEGWNLIGILRDTNAGSIGTENNKITIAQTTLNNLRSNGNLVFTMFAPLVVDNNKYKFLPPIGVNPTDTQITFTGYTFSENRAYWIIVPGVSQFNYYSNIIPKP